jgi:hypothetical protein
VLQHLQQPQPRAGVRERVADIEHRPGLRDARPAEAGGRPGLRDAPGPILPEGEV